MYNQNKLLPEQTADKIMQHIIDNNLKPGDKIPNETELGEIIGVGRSTVREAVRTLVSRNILKIRRGAGTYICDNTGVSDDPLGLAFQKDKYKLAMDMLQVRIILEPEIAAIAASTATQQDIEKITNLCNIVEQKINQNIDHMPDDIAFHQAIATCTNNIIITKLIPIINSSVALFGSLTSRQLKTETIHTHREIANAIAAHDSVNAKYAMTMHLLYNNKRIRELIEERDRVSSAGCSGL